MTFNLDDREVTIIRVIQIKSGVIIGFFLPNIPIPQRIKFENRSLPHSQLQPDGIIRLCDETLRALNWKEGDHLHWTVYSDRIDFHKDTS